MGGLKRSSAARRDCTEFRISGQRSTFCRVLLAAFVLLLGRPLTMQSQIMKPTEPEVPVASETVRIPDGTEIKMRFAQPMFGRVARSLGDIFSPPPKFPARNKPNDVIRLVVAADVRLGGDLIVSRGAIAQATVTKVDLILPGSSIVRTGLWLRLDWVTAATGDRLPLRASRNGDASPFRVDVLEEKSGLVVREPNPGRDLAEFVTGKILITNSRARKWVPTGTRILGFVHEDAMLNRAALSEAQQSLPAPNPTALVTFYRTKGHATRRAVIVCSGGVNADIGEYENKLVELSPEEAECTAGESKPFQFAVTAGEEYYVRVRGHHHGWELQQVDLLQGEDEIADTELRGQKKKER